jgi:hypothetical protein
MKTRRPENPAGNFQFTIALAVGDGSGRRAARLPPSQAEDGNDNGDNHGSDGQGPA